MKKSASLGDECIELLNQNSLSQILPQAQNPLLGSSSIAIHNNHNLITNSTAMNPVQPNNKLPFHQRTTSSNIFLDNDISTKEMNGIISSQQPQTHLLNSLQPSHSQSMQSSQRHFEHLNNEFEKHVDAREGASTRSRLFVESKDLLPPKSAIFGEEDEEVPTGEVSFHSSSHHSQQPLSSFLQLQQESFQQKLAPQKMVHSTEKKDPPSLLGVYDKPRISQVSSQSMQSALAFKQHLIKEASSSNNNNNNAMSHSQQPSTHAVGINGSNLVNLISSGMGNTFSQQQRKSIFTSFPSNQNNNVSPLIHPHLKSISTTPLPLPQSQQPSATTNRVSAVKTFMNINKFAFEIRKVLQFTRPLLLSSLQLSCINDLASQTYNEIQSNASLTKKQIAAATRNWIHAPRSLRRIKQSLKPLYICLYKTQVNIQHQIGQIPCIASDSTINVCREGLITLITLTTYIVVPLDCAFTFSSTHTIKTICGIICLLNILMVSCTEQYANYRRINTIKETINRYASTNLIADAITSVSLFCFSSYRLISLIFFLRIIYDQSIVSFIKSQVISTCQRLTTIIGFLFPLFITLFHCHLLACAWFYTASYNCEDSSGWIQLNQMTNIPQSELYLKSFTFMTQLITTANTTNLIFPSSTNNTETIFLLLTSIYGCLVLAYIFSAIHSNLKWIPSVSSYPYMREQTKLHLYLQERNIPRKLQLEAKRQFEIKNTLSGLESQQQFKQFNVMEQLTIPLQEKILKEVFLSAVQTNETIMEFFSNPRLLHQLSLRVREVTFSAGQLILQQNNLAMPCLNFIINGSVEIFIEKGINQSPSILKVLNRNSSFGELEFFSQTFVTSLSVRARTPTTILAIAMSDFHDEVQAFPEEKEALCFLKDSMLFNNDNLPIGLACLSCNSYRHSLAKCPLVAVQKSMENAFRSIEQQVAKDIASFRRSRNRRRFTAVGMQSQLQEAVLGFTANHDDLMNSSLYEEYLDEVNSDKQSYHKQQTQPNVDVQSNYSRKTSKKLSLKQSQTVDDLRNSFKNPSQKLLNPNSLEEIQEKSSISKVSQFSNRATIRVDAEEKRLSGGQSQLFGNNPQSSDSDFGGANSRKRTHSGLSQFLGSRTKSPFHSEKEWNQQYSGSLVSSLRLSEAERKIFSFDERIGHESSKQQIGTPNVFVIKINEGGDHSSVGGVGGNSGGSSQHNNRGQYYSNSIGNSIFAQNNPVLVDAIESLTSVRKNSSSYSLFSRNNPQSSQYLANEEFSELRLDQQTLTNRGRNNSFFPIGELDQGVMPTLSLDNINSPRKQEQFEEQQNFKMYFAHNNLQNVIGGQQNGGGGDAKSSRSRGGQQSRKYPKVSKYLRVVSVNSKPYSPLKNKQMKPSSTTGASAAKNFTFVNTTIPNQNEQISALLPYKKISDLK